MNMLTLRTFKCRGCRLHLKVGGGLGFGMDHGRVREGVRELGENNTMHQLSVAMKTLSSI